MAVCLDGIIFHLLWLLGLLLLEGIDNRECHEWIAEKGFKTMEHEEDHDNDGGSESF